MNRVQRSLIAALAPSWSVQEPSARLPQRADVPQAASLRLLPVRRAQGAVLASTRWCRASSTSPASRRSWIT